MGYTYEKKHMHYIYIYMCVCVCAVVSWRNSSYFKIVKYFIINIVSVLLCLRNFNFISLLSYIYVYMLNQFYIYSIVITIKLNQISNILILLQLVTYLKDKQF